MSDQKQTYNVLSSLRHNSDAYGPDIEDMETVDLTEAEAAPLEKLKVVELAEPDDSMSDEDREGILRETMALLDPETDFTKAGNPKQKVVTEVVGFEVSVAEIQAAWKAHQSDKKKEE